MNALIETDGKASGRAAGKAAGAIFGTVALVGGAMVLPAFAAGDAVAAEPAAEFAADGQDVVASDSGVRSVAEVVGEFAYTQDAVTSNGAISSVFCKAASAVCASLPQYGLECARMVIDIASGDAVLSATVGEMSDEDAAVSHLMGCSCASNVAGGGAVANAEVFGVSMAAVAALAGAL